MHCRSLVVLVGISSFLADPVGICDFSGYKVDGRKSLRARQQAMLAFEFDAAGLNRTKENALVGDFLCPKTEKVKIINALDICDDQSQLMKKRKSACFNSSNYLNMH